VQIEIPQNAEDLARSKANLAGFSDVGQYIVSLIFRDDWASDPPDAATNDPACERLVLEGLNSGTPQPVADNEFDRVRKRLRSTSTGEANQ
jgi:hypothetical protein